MGSNDDSRDRWCGMVYFSTLFLSKICVDKVSFFFFFITSIFSGYGLYRLGNRSNLLDVLGTKVKIYISIRKYTIRKEPT